MTFDQRSQPFANSIEVLVSNARSRQRGRLPQRRRVFCVELGASAFQRVLDHTGRELGLKEFTLTTAGRQLRADARTAGSVRSSP